MEEGSVNKNSYKNLIVWQKSMELATAIYEMTEGFPKEEVYGLTSQMRRSAISIPSNIAEGKNRKSDPELVRFLKYSFASGGELETQIEIAKRLKKTRGSNFLKVDSLLDEVMRILNKMINDIGKKAKS